MSREKKSPRPFNGKGHQDGDQTCNDQVETQMSSLPAQFYPAIAIFASERFVQCQVLEGQWVEQPRMMLPRLERQCRVLKKVFRMLLSKMHEIWVPELQNKCFLWHIMSHPCWFGFLKVEVSEPKWRPAPFAGCSCKVSSFGVKKNG